MYRRLHVFISEMSEEQAMSQYRTFTAQMPWNTPERLAASMIHPHW